MLWCLTLPLTLKLLQLRPPRRLWARSILCAARANGSDSWARVRRHLTLPRPCRPGTSPMQPCLCKLRRHYRQQARIYWQASDKINLNAKNKLEDDFTRRITFFPIIPRKRNPPFASNEMPYKKRRVSNDENSNNIKNSINIKNNASQTFKDFGQNRWSPTQTRGVSTQSPWHGLSLLFTIQPKLPEILLRQWTRKFRHHQRKSQFRWRRRNKQEESFGMIPHFPSGALYWRGTSNISYSRCPCSTLDSTHTDENIIIHGDETDCPTPADGIGPMSKRDPRAKNAVIPKYNNNISDKALDLDSMWATTFSTIYSQYSGNSRNCMHL